MTHATNSPYVRWHIDSFEKTKGSLYKITGWIFHQNKEIKNILIGDSILNYKITPRLDVEQVYPFVVNPNIGFEFHIEEFYLSKPISLILEDNSGVVNIGNLKSYISNFYNINSVSNLTQDYILNSGFDNPHKGLIVVDDVLNSGTTLIYAVRHFLDVPLTKFKTAVLVDRNHKKYPVKADFKGISLSTSLLEHVRVVFDENGQNPDS
jgi:hypothetical protein